MPNAILKPAHEVREFEWFGKSRWVHVDREGVKYRVGQVFTHKQHGYKGLIIGWDKHCNAPGEWMDRMGVAESSRSEPFYSVLVDYRPSFTLPFFVL